jgi:hypothetical protein
LPNTISGGEIGIQKKHLTKVTHIEAGIYIPQNRWLICNYIPYVVAIMKQKAEPLLSLPFLFDN